jgi:hypothetical protein
MNADDLDDNSDLSPGRKELFNRLNCLNETISEKDA